MDMDRFPFIFGVDLFYRNPFYALLPLKPQQPWDLTPPPLDILTSLCFSGNENFCSQTLKIVAFLFSHVDSEPKDSFQIPFPYF